MDDFFLTLDAQEYIKFGCYLSHVNLRMLYTEILFIIVIYCRR